MAPGDRDRGAGVLRLGFTVTRRLVAGKVSLGVEFDLRNRMYAHLQSLELGFFDRQQTGQLMSRATVDLQSVRFFLGYGLVFIAAERADDRARGGRDVRRSTRRWPRWRSLPVPFVVLVAARYGRRSRPALQEVQQRIAELTAEVEENISGVRVVKAFAREERQLERFRARGRRGCSTSRWSPRACAPSTTRSSASCRSSAWRRSCFVGGRQVINGDADARRVHRLLRLPAAC